MKLPIAAGILSVFVFAFLQISFAQAAPTLSVSPSTGLPGDTYTFTLTNFQIGLFDMYAKMTLQYCKLESGACTWKNLGDFVDLYYGGSAEFTTSLDKFTIDGVPIKSLYKINSEEKFRLKVQRQTENGDASGNVEETGTVSVKFTEFCKRGTVTVDVKNPADKTLEIPISEDTDQPFSYTIAIKNNDDLSCGDSSFSITRTTQIEIIDEKEKVSSTTESIGKISPGKSSEKTFQLLVKRGVESGSDISLIAENQNSKTTGKATIETVFAEQEVLECKKAPKVSFDDPSVSDRKVAPNIPISFEVEIQNDNDKGCPAAEFELTKVGIDPAPATSSESTSKTQWIVGITEENYGYEFSTSLAQENFKMATSSSQDLVKYTPLQRILFSLKPGEKRSFKMVFVSPINSLGPDDGEGNRQNNRVISFCAKTKSGSDETCAKDFITQFLPKRTDDKLAPIIIFAGTNPENPLTGEEASPYIVVQDQYKIKSVKFITNNDEELYTYSQPNVTKKSDAKMKLSSDKYRIEVLDWNDNKVCFPSDCISEASPKFGSYSDPQITSMKLDKTSANAPDKLMATVTVKNGGNADAKDLMVRMWLHNELVAENFLDHVLKSGESKDFTEEIIIGGEVPEGKHRIVAEVYSPSGVKERDAINNRKSVEFTTQASATSGNGGTTETVTSGSYTLEVSSDKDSYKIGETVKLSGKLKLNNVGTSGKKVSLQAKHTTSTVSSKPFELFTASDGSFAFDFTTVGASAGKWKIIAGFPESDISVEKEIELLSESDHEVEFQTDKDTYKVGENIKVTGKLMLMSDIGLSVPLANSKVVLSAENTEKGISSKPFEVTTTTGGSFVFDFLTSGAPAGKWKIKVTTLGGTSVEKEVEITETSSGVKADGVDVSLDKESYKVGETVRVSIKTKAGSAIAPNTKIQIQAKNVEKNHNSKVFEGTTVSDGSYTFDFLTSGAASYTGDWTIIVTAVDSDGKTLASGEKKTTIS